MFELLGISLLLACLLTFNSLASLVTAGSWRLGASLTSHWSATGRARLLFLLRTFPALLAILCVIFLLIPSYLAYEPRHTNESVSFKLGLLAFLSATGIGFAITRTIAAWRVTARLTADWLAKADRIDVTGVSIPAFRIEHAFPVIAIVGVWRPRLFIASQILEILSEEEIAAAVAHENGHLGARDNLKRGLMRACRDALLIIPTGRLLDRAWAEAAEEAADENAARQGVNVALDLATALVKIARKIPKGTRPTMPAGVFLFGEADEANPIKFRVSRLVELAASNREPQLPRAPIAAHLIWCAAGLAILAIGFLVPSENILATFHAWVEHAVYLLK